jgi:hypothetical protein
MFGLNRQRYVATYVSVRLRHEKLIAPPPPRQEILTLPRIPDLDLTGQPHCPKGDSPGIVL